MLQIAEMAALAHTSVRVDECLNSSILGLQTVQRSSESGSREMVVSIPMPGRKNAKGVDLSVSATEVNLEGVSGFEPLRVNLPVRASQTPEPVKFS